MSARACAHVFEQLSSFGDPYERCTRCGVIGDAPVDAEASGGQEVCEAGMDGECWADDCPLPSRDLVQGSCPRRPGIALERDGWEGREDEAWADAVDVVARWCLAVPAQSDETLNGLREDACEAVAKRIDALTPPEPPWDDFRAACDYLPVAAPAVDAPEGACEVPDCEESKGHAGPAWQPDQLKTASSIQTHADPYAGTRPSPLVVDAVPAWLEHYKESERLLGLVAGYPQEMHEWAQATATAALAEATLAAMKLECLP